MSILMTCIESFSLSSLALTPSSAKLYCKRSMVTKVQTHSCFADQDTPASSNKSSLLPRSHTLALSTSIQSYVPLAVSILCKCICMFLSTPPSFSRYLASWSFSPRTPVRASSILALARLSASVSVMGPYDEGSADGSGWLSVPRG